MVFAAQTEDSAGKSWKEAFIMRTAQQRISACLDANNALALISRTRISTNAWPSKRNMVNNNKVSIDIRNKQKR